MSTPNISAVLESPAVALIKQKISEITAMLPFLVNITAEDKKKLFKMGTSSVSFVEESLRVAKNHPDILPNNFIVDEFEKDVNLTLALSDIASVVIPLSEGITDT